MEISNFLPNNHRPNITRPNFDAQAGPQGAFLVGSPENVADKIKRHSDALGGISRVTFQMDTANLSHEKLMKSIELIGKRVIPILSQIKSFEVDKQVPAKEY